jgi:uncharacterized HAD superfamily protein
MSSNRLKIGVDIDGVLIDMDPKKYLEFCAKEFGWKTDYEVYAQTHSWPQATGQTEEAVISHAWGTYLETIEDAQSPIEGAHDALRELGKTADIYLITARSNSQLKATEEVIRKHLPDVQYIELSMGNVLNKIQPVIDFGIDYYIDDSYREIVLILQNKEIATKIIPFPSFHATKRWDELEDDRLIWLKTWDAVGQDMEASKRKLVYKNAWEEIREIIQDASQI